MVRPRRIGLYGGSFDPVHVTHRRVADTALAQLALDELRWVVAGQPWQKVARALAPAEHRAAMVELAIADDPRQRLERCEIERHGPSYTLDTVRELQAIEAASGGASDWFLVIGQDQCARFSTWHGWHELLQRVTLAVVGRAGEVVQPAPELAGVAHRLIRLEMAPSAVSSTAIRQHLEQGGEAARLVPDALSASIAAYIAQARLYHRDPAPT
ncbi:MAG: nicotinate-nucleotide adenylyltransferase [Leptothrix sp. (in: b-proteobacteria)]